MAQRCQQLDGLQASVTKHWEASRCDDLYGNFAADDEVDKGCSPDTLPAAWPEALTLSHNPCLLVSRP